MRKQLYRSRKHRIFGGVAGGLAEYFELDPVLIRVIFVIVALISGFGFLLYIILWIVIPEEPFELTYNINKEDVDAENLQESYPQSGGKGRTILGIILIIIGLLLLAEQYIAAFDFEDLLPIALIVIGIFLIWNSTRK
ncbi:PspC domain-containing protein [Melioribacter sp. OK-6-Me]|uniref:PspC domain-containing protein n=1 Tax=unclassified Melioribacter TaxID=2627329 RepID=UPI003ED96CB7